MTTVEELVDLLDWKRRIFLLYRQIRLAGANKEVWHRWRAERDEMFATHSQSPIPERDRAAFEGLSYFAYDPAWRTAGRLKPAEVRRYEISTSAGPPMAFQRVATVSFEFGGSAYQLEVYWLEAYGGGLFLPFVDATSGTTTYGAGRYLFDTVKGADLGSSRDELILDFNYAYNPSCAYDPRWVCPLAPQANRLPLSVEAGEKAPPADA